MRHLHVILALCLTISIPAFSAPNSHDAVISVLPAQRGMFLSRGIYKHDPPRLEQLVAAIDAERSGEESFLLVCGGNFVPPHGYPNIRKPKSATWVSDSERLQDPTLWRLMNAIGIDVMTPGHAELSHSSRWLREMQQACPSMHMVSINVADTTGKLIFPPYVVLKRGGIRFGVLGMSGDYQEQVERIGIEALRSVKDTTSEKTGISKRPIGASKDRVHTRIRALNSIGRDLRIQAPSREGLSRAVTELRDQCDVLVAVLELPMEAGDSLLRQVSGIDIAVVPYPLPGGTQRIGGCTVIFGNYGTNAFTKASVHGSHGVRGIDAVSVSASPDRGRADIADRIQSWEHLTKIEQELSTMWSRTTRSSEDEGFFGRLDSLATGSGGRTDVFVLWPEGDEGQLTWVGGLEPLRRPLSSDLAHPVTIRTLQEVRRGSTRALPVGSDDETRAIQLLQFLAASQGRGAETESVLAILEERQRREAPWTEWGRSLDSLQAVLEHQRDAMTPGNPPYWRRRSVIYASIAPGEPSDDITILENNDWPVAPDLPVRQFLVARNAAEGRRIVIALAKDRQETKFEAGLEAVKTRWGKEGRPARELLPDDVLQWKGTHLPKKARNTLDSKDMSSLVSVWKKADPEFSWDDFISTPSDSLVPNADGMPRDSGSSVLKKLKTSKDGYLLVGWSTVEHPRFPNGTWGHLQVPTVWLSEPKKPYLLRFQGALTPQINAPDVRQALEATLTGSPTH